MNQKHLVWFAGLTAAILLVPLIAMQFTSEVAWGLGDFVFIGVLLFGSGLVYELAAAKLPSRTHRIVAAVALIMVVVCIWGMAAVGFDYIDAHLVG
jgi:TRAP-type C4-dicarboxylate transport system permease small subunit